MDLGKPLRVEIKTKLWPYLRDEGFTEFTELAARRKGDRWIDCVQVSPHDLNRGHPRLPWASPQRPTFSIEVGVYYTDLHLLPWIGPVPERPLCDRGESSKLPVCHRTVTLARSFRAGMLPGTQFPLADDGSDVDHVFEDAVAAIRARGLAWLEKGHDIDAYLALVDADGEEYDGSLELSEAEQAEWSQWLENRGEPFPFNLFADDLPDGLRDRFEREELRDHTAMASNPPQGDLFHGLLIGQGRRAEAIEALRRASDPAFAEERYRQILAVPVEDRAALKRMAHRERKFWEAHLAAEREHLAILEAMPPDSDSRGKG